MTFDVIGNSSSGNRYKIAITASTTAANVAPYEIIEIRVDRCSEDISLTSLPAKEFNDESFNRSVLNNLLATRDLDHIEEEIERSGNRNIPTAKAYLPRRAYLFNCMWGLVGQSDIGTLYFSESTNTMNLLDQFIVSRGLFYGKQKLKMDLGSVNIFKPSIMTTRKGRPIPFDKKTKKGFSDHFPIECIVRKV